MKHYAELVVRSYECDSYGHVNNAVYLNYLEYGRMEYLHQIKFDYNGIVDAGYYLYITHIDIHYRSSAFLDDRLVIEITPVELKAVSGTFQQIIRKQDGTVCADALVTWASVKKGGRLAKLPDQFMVPGLVPDPADLHSV
jgi:acyl-CoA thioester hydrolase